MIRYIISQEPEEEINSLTIKKIEKNYANEEENEHVLEFTTAEENKNLIVKVDTYVLYEEEKDLVDPVKQLQVSDKMKKFIFLLQEKQSDLQEKYEVIKEEKEKKRAFRDIFRNF